MFCRIIPSTVVRTSSCSKVRLPNFAVLSRTLGTLSRHVSGEGWVYVRARYLPGVISVPFCLGRRSKCVGRTDYFLCVGRSPLLSYIEQVHLVGGKCQAKISWRRIGFGKLFRTDSGFQGVFLAGSAELSKIHSSSIYSFPVSGERNRDRYILSAQK